MLGDRNSNCLNLYYDDRGRIVEISGEQQRPCIRLYYELAAHPRRVTQIYQHFLRLHLYCCVVTAMTRPAT